MERINKLAALCSLSFLVATFGVIRAQAQDAPAAPAPSTPSEPGATPPAEPAPPPAPGAEVPGDPAPPNPAPASPPADVAPPSVAPPSVAPPSAAPPDSAPPGAAPPTGNAAYESLPDAQPKHHNRPRASAPAAAPPAAPVSTPPTVAPAEQSAPRSSDPVAPPEPDKANDDEGLFGPFRIGVLVGGGLPDLLSLGGMIKLTRYFGAGINIGLIPTVKISLYGDATVAFQEYDAYGHIFPFGGAFFMGAGVGYANVHGTIANRYTLTPTEYAVAMVKGYRGSSTLEVDSQANVRTLVLTPQIGLLKTFQAGFTLGIDVGAQVPIAPSKVDFSTTVPPGLPAPVVSSITTADGKVRSTLSSIGRTILPTVGVKIGWLL
ncbi:MAG TPA: hypothetical protein VIK01_27995 [Polyangiaceae bacterium]